MWDEYAVSCVLVGDEYAVSCVLVGGMSMLSVMWWRGYEDM